MLGKIFKSIGFKSISFKFPQAIVILSYETFSAKWAEEGKKRSDLWSK